jgi:hypothetical protein
MEEGRWGKLGFGGPEGGGGEDGELLADIDRCREAIVKAEGRMWKRGVTNDNYERAAGTDSNGSWQLLKKYIY